MIAYLNGKIAELEPSFVVIDVNGVGYEVKISLNTFTDIKSSKETLLHTYLHVREDAQILFGFSKKSERAIFNTLISVNGVGVSTALIILSTLSPEELHSAIINNDINTLKSVKGIGLKTAQRIVLELKDKLAKSDSPEMLNFSASPHNTLKQDALTALVTLGLNKTQAETAIDKLIKASDKELTVEYIIKQVLKSSY